MITLPVTVEDGADGGWDLSKDIKSLFHRKNVLSLFILFSYMPEYNPIERFFNTVKAKFCDEEKITSLAGMADFIIEKCLEIPK